jgi:hypothetical protein
MNNNTVINTMGIEAGNSFEDTLKHSDLDFEVAFDKVAGMDTGIAMPNRKLIYRADTRQALGIASDDYVASCPREFLRSQYELAEHLGGKVSRAGFISSRSRAFAFVNYTDIEIPRNKRKVGDVCRAYIYSSDGWDGMTPRRSRLYVERLACSNGMTSREIKADFYLSHQKNMETRHVARFGEFVADVKESVESIRKDFMLLAASNINQQGMKDFLLKLIPGEGARPEGRREEIFQLFNTGVGNKGATRWDAYNAVTEYVTHHRTYRTTENTSVEVNRFLGVLETDLLNKQALNLLLA